MQSNSLQLRYATIKDIPCIIELIRGIAEYEKLSHEVVVTEALLKEWLFTKEYAKVIIASLDNKDIGYTLFFHTFSTFLGRAGIHIEDLYIKPEFRGHGYGKTLLMTLVNIAVEGKFGRLEWTCLNWNHPSINLYLSLGATPMHDWTMFRLTSPELKKLAENNKIHTDLIK